MSFSARGSIPQEGAQGSNEWKNTRVKRAVRISSIVAQEVSSQARYNVFLLLDIHCCVKVWVSKNFVFFFFFIQQEHIKLIKSYSKNT